jgi:hypothetical protein
MVWRMAWTSARTEAARSQRVGRIRYDLEVVRI